MNEPLRNTIAAASLFGSNPEARARLAAATRALSEADERLAHIIERVGACALTIRTPHDPFNTLARSIIHQQLSGRVAGVIHERVVRTLTDKRVLAPEDVLAATDEALRGAGLSAAKARALRDLAARTLDGTVPTLVRLRRMDDEAIIRQLIVVRGVGRWTIEMLLMFRLGRPDVLPADDFAIRKSVGLMDGMSNAPKPAEVLRRGERWRPFRTVASWYLWRQLDLPPS